MVRNIRATKMRNEWSILIMNKLLENTSMYQFSKDIPSLSSHYPMIPDHAKFERDDECSPYSIIMQIGYGLTGNYLHSTLSSSNEEHEKGNHLIQP